MASYTGGRRHPSPCPDRTRLSWHFSFRRVKNPPSAEAPPLMRRCPAPRAESPHALALQPDGRIQGQLSQTGIKQHASARAKRNARARAKGSLDNGQGRRAVLKPKSGTPIGRSRTHPAASNGWRPTAGAGDRLTAPPPPAPPDRTTCMDAGAPLHCRHAELAIPD